VSTVRRAADLVLQRASGSDLDQVMEVMRGAFDPSFGEAWTRAQCGGILPMSGVRMVIARSDGRPVGFSLSRHVLDEAELLLLAVAPDMRGMGIGTALLGDFVVAGQETGLRRLHLEVRDSNPAVKLYQQHQFVVEGRRPNYYRGTDGTTHDALTMGRTIERD
jgi:[ribosomal protein S18]-alanine N-acetyltransferase